MDIIMVLPTKLLFLCTRKTVKLFRQLKKYNQCFEEQAMMLKEKRLHTQYERSVVLIYQNEESGGEMFPQ